MGNYEPLHAKPREHVRLKRYARRTLSPGDVAVGVVWAVIVTHVAQHNSVPWFFLNLLFWQVGLTVWFALRELNAWAHSRNLDE